MVPADDTTIPVPPIDPGPAPTAPSGPPPEFGVEETKQLLNFVVQLGNGIDQSLADNKLDFWDAVKFYGALKAAIPAFNNIKALKPELAHLDAAEVADLVVYAKGQLNFAGSDAAIQAQVSSALDLGNNIYAYIVSLKK